MPFAFHQPADWARRDGAAVAALQPANGAEGQLAAQFVAADAWALAEERRFELEIARKCRARAAMGSASLTHPKLAWQRPTLRKQISLNSSKGQE
jgi:hypothetical protein